MDSVIKVGSQNVQCSMEMMQAKLTKVEMENADYKRKLDEIKLERKRFLEQNSRENSKIIQLMRENEVIKASIQRVLKNSESKSSLECSPNPKKRKLSGKSLQIPAGNRARVSLLKRGGKALKPPAWAISSDSEASENEKYDESNENEV